MLRHWLTARITHTAVTVRYDKVVERQRKSDETSDAEFEAAGEKDGRQWAGTKAEAVELRRLDKALDPARDWYFSEGSSAYSAAELFFFIIQPELEGQRSDAYEFWESVTGDREVPEAAYVQGFAAGAMEVWGEVKHLVSP